LVGHTASLVLGARLWPSVRKKKPTASAIEAIPAQARLRFAVRSGGGARSTRSDRPLRCPCTASKTTGSARPWPMIWGLDPGVRPLLAADRESPRLTRASHKTADNCTGLLEKCECRDTVE